MSAEPVIVPATLAGQVLRLLVVGLELQFRRDGGGRVPTELEWFLHALEHAATAHDKGPKPSGFADESDSVPSRTLETVGQAARRIGCSEQWVRALCRSGRLPARRVGSVWLIEHGSADEREVG